MSSFAKRQDIFSKGPSARLWSGAANATAFKNPGPVREFDKSGLSQPSQETMKHTASGLEAATKTLEHFQTSSANEPSFGRSTPARLAARILNPLEPSGLAASTLMLAAGATHGPAMLVGALAGLAFMPNKASAWMPQSTGMGYKASGIATDIGNTVQSFADMVMPMGDSNNKPMAQKIKGAERQYRDYTRAMNDILALDNSKNPKMKGDSISFDQWHNMGVSTKDAFYRNGALTLSEMGVNTDVLGTRKLDPKLSAPGVQFPSLGLG